MVDYVQSLRPRPEIGILSNIPADHADALLAAHPWLRDLDHLLLSEYTGTAKPAPAANQHCVHALNATPHDFLFIDDRPGNTHAAHQIGMYTHTFRRQADLATVIDDWLTDAPDVGSSARRDPAIEDGSPVDQLGAIRTVSVELSVREIGECWCR
jgi:putative hydrolase of the HAD superfamily